MCREFNTKVKQEITWKKELKINMATASKEPELAIVDKTSTISYHISFNVKGLSPTGKFVVWYLDLNSKKASNKETILKSGVFTFDTTIDDGATYSIIIEQHPVGQTCKMKNAIGKIDGNDVFDAEITCVDLPPMAVSFSDSCFVGKYVSGYISITRSPDETDIKTYALKWGSDNFIICCDLFKNCSRGKITEIEKTGEDIKYYLDNSRLFPSNRIVLDSLDQNGHVLNSVFTLINDVDVVDNLSYFKNWFGTESVMPKKMLYPKTLKELIDSVKWAGEKGSRVRMTGQGHSISDITITEGVLLQPRFMEGLLKLNTKQLRKGEDAKLMIQVLGGTKISTLNQILDEKNLAMGILGGFDGQTIVGSAMTSTHGSSLEYGPLSDFILSMQVVGENGNMYQIEATNGITDPLRFKGLVDGKFPIKLIQDDDTFNAMKVSIGSMGIIYSVVLQVEQKFWIHEERSVITWKEFKNNFLKRVVDHANDRNKKLEDRGGEGFKENDPTYYKFQVNPYENGDGEHLVLLTKRWKLLEKNRENDSLILRGRRGNYTLTEISRIFQKPLAEIINIPHFKHLLAASSIDTAIKLQEEPGEGFNHKSYKVFDIGNPNHFDVKAIELHFDIQNTEKVMEQIFQTAKTLVDDKGLVISAPLVGRFIKASNSLIAMQNGRDTFAVEIIVLQDIDNGAQLLEHYEMEYTKNYMARPHWGLSMNYMKSENEARRLYPHTWDDWIIKYREFNKGSFDGKFTDRLEISVKTLK